MSDATTPSRQTRKPRTSLQNSDKVGRRPQQTRSRQTRDSILLAATGLFKEEGPTALSFAGIAHAAGVSVGAVQFYFANKEAILEAVISRILDDNLDAEVSLFQRLEGACGRFDEFLDAYVAGYHDLLAQFNPHFAKSIDIIKRNATLSAKGRDIGAKAEVLAKGSLGAALTAAGWCALRTVSMRPIM
jgi:AcrR family transcriptional regulator